MGTYDIVVKTVAKFIHSETLKELNVEERINTVCESLEELESVAEEYDIEVDAEPGTTEYEHELIKAVGEKARLAAITRANKITDAIKEIYLNGDQYGGYVELGGYIIRTEDFCAVKIAEISVDIKERK